MKLNKHIRELAEEILQEYTSCYSEADEDCLAKMLENKFGEFAREIFEEIFNLMNDVYSSVQYGCYSYAMTKHTDSPAAQRQCGKLEGVKYLGDKIAELKKKYTEGCDG